jgi:hypothetical protein
MGREHSVMSTMNAIQAPIDQAAEALSAQGWSIGDIGGIDAWTVYGHRAERVIDAHGRTQTEAWAAASVQAEAMAGRLPALAP